MTRGTLGKLLWCCLAVAPGGLAPAAELDPVPVDLAGYRADCGVTIQRDGQRLQVRWPLDRGGKQEVGQVTLDLSPGKPLVESIALAGSARERYVRCSGSGPGTGPSGPRWKISPTLIPAASSAFQAASMSETMT